MKTIKLGDEIKRVSDIEAVKMVSEGWKYCPKMEWKKLNRKASQKRVVSEEVEEGEVPAKKRIYKKKDSGYKAKKYSKKASKETAQSS